MSEVTGLKTYGGVDYGTIENDIDINNDEYEYWSGHISISRKYFDEVLSMRDEYQSMFEEFFEKFKGKMKRKLELEKALEAEQRKVKELQEVNEKYEENIEVLSRKFAEKEAEVEELVLQKQENVEKISKLEANLQEVLSERKQLLEYEEKCEYLEVCNKEAQETIDVLQIARDMYQTESKWLKKKYEGDSSTVQKKTPDQNDKSDAAVNVFGYRRAKVEKELFDTKKIVHDLKEHTTNLESLIAKKGLEIFELKTENGKFSDGFKLQQKIIDDLKEELIKMNDEKERIHNALTTLKQTNKELELKTCQMADSFDDIYRLIQEANELLVPKKCFGKFFKRGRGQQGLMKEYLKQIEDITNIFE